MAVKAKRKAREKRAAADPLPADESGYARDQVAMKRYVDLLNEAGGVRRFRT